jgi:sortase A
LNRGAWRLPDSSTPDIGGNTVITGHRFKYLPPNNLTFYLLDKLAVGDKIDIKWKGKILKYEVYLTKVVPAEDTTVIAPTDEPILTVFTCDPIFSTKNRLVVLAKPIK